MTLSCPGMSYPVPFDVGAVVSGGLILTLVLLTGALFPHTLSNSVLFPPVPIVIHLMV